MIRLSRQSRFSVLFVSFVLSVFSCGPSVSGAPADNAEIKQIFDADQKDREGPPDKLDWPKINPRDAARRSRVRELLEQGQLRTGKDYERAAFVFQHGEGSDDILMAHVLAVTAIGKGDLGARWIAAAALDRLLQRAGKPQIFGTQFQFKTEGGQTNWTMEPYNRTLVPPGLREANCVPSLEQQSAMLEALSAGREPPAGKQPCK
jgi:hypothetical protein